MALPAFPNPVNETSARIVAAGVVGMATIAITADQPWLLVPLTYGFAARVVAGPTFSLAMRARIIPKSTCEACEDIWSRYPGGRPATNPSLYERGR